MPATVGQLIRQTMNPTKTPAGASESQRDNYRRAMSACLDGRGYTVK